MSKQLQNIELLERIVFCIKEIRKSKNITLEIFYFDTGIHLARIEQGKHNVTISTLANICLYFDIELSDFFLLVENKNKK
ncbi:helix-turn-helix domain-containing protein [Flavobacterium restrictum]|uniref:Helix-turn-helix transcriptional regulator n=1 Tax=Flavobacterium restrictum TaxID=2594428 RepID=A0A553EAQ0_9FLAO|nr:helix-turn-helix transcriptional regulator [Flavobacterium restrictum]TRX42108.1 helix-turn-helix transcriptional regulator [Flavobacterium restrictum]